MVEPWRTVASRTVLHDRWINVRADDCLTATGKTVAPFYVLTYPDFVHAVAILPGERLLLVEQYRQGVASAVLELPGGMMDPADEDPVKTAQRELLEETGYSATKWQLVSSLFVNPATHTNRIHFVLAEGCECVTKPELEPGEEGMAIRITSISDVIAGLRTGYLGQAMHVAGLLLALELRRVSGGGSPGEG